MVVENSNMHVTWAFKHFYLHLLQYFHEIDESAPWLLEDLKRIAQTFDVNKFKGDYNDAKRLLKELEVGIHSLLHCKSCRSMDRLMD